MNNLNDILQNAVAAHRAGETEKAADLYRQVLALAPDNNGALSNLATLLASQGQLVEASGLYRQALLRTPDDVSILINLGQIIQNQGDHAEALSLYNRALEIDPDHLMIKTRMADLHLVEGNAETAADLYQEIVAADPSQSRVLSNYAAALNALERFDEALIQAINAVRLEENNPDAHNNLGRIKLALERYDDAVTSFERAIDLRPDWYAPHLDLGVTWQRKNMFAEAISSLEVAWQLNPGDLETGKALGSALISTGQTDTANKLLEALEERHPEDPEIPFHQAISSRADGNPEDAVTLFRKAISLGLDAPEVHNNLAVSLFDIGKMEEAHAAAMAAIALDPGFAAAYNTLGNWASEVEDLETARNWYLKASELDLGFAAAISNVAYVTRLQGKLNEAISFYKKALEVAPELPEAWSGIGLTYQQDNRVEEALEAFDTGLATHPENWELLNNKAISLQAKGQTDQALETYRLALHAKKDNPEIYYNLGNLLQSLDRTDEAINMFNAALKLRPNYNSVYSYLAHSLMRQCNWLNLESAIEHIVQNIATEVKSGKTITTSPFSMLSLPVPAEYRLLSAMQLSRQKAADQEYRRKGITFDYAPKGEKLKVGYFSPDFRRHSLGLTFLDLLLAHEHDNFEFYGYGVFSHNQDEVTDQFRKHFDHFTDLSEYAYQDAARKIADDGINILVDLAGFTKGSRLEIFSFLPAPVQVHYLGYGHTLGADFIPWLITDHAVMPDKISEFCSEELVFLPDSFLATTRHEISDEKVTRADFNLPEDAFVLANFNGGYKIDPKAFAVWMRFLRKTPDAVLWFQAGSPGAEKNLRREAEARGVSADRLVFAPMIPHTSHLGRLHLADLAVDALYHSGGVTTTDAIWAGLPLLTVSGPTPSAQTGVSVLQAANLPEMITYSLDEYEKRLYHLAAHRDELISIREKMAATRDTVPLFDSNRLARHLESAYNIMWKQHDSGLAPKSFDVPPID